MIVGWRKLKHVWLSKQLMSDWALPTVAGIALFVITQPVMASFIEGANMATVTAEQVEFGSEPVAGYQQIFFKRNGAKTFITRDRFNHTSPVGRGEYVIWIKTVNGAGQIELYHLPTGAKLAITSLSTNQNPRVDEQGRVVWERWVEDRWQIFLFDGYEYNQVTTGDVAVRPDISADQIIYATQSKSGYWQSKKYTISSRQTELIKQGPEAAWPYFAGDVIKFQFIPKT